MTVADNIAYGLQQHEVTRQDIEYAATEVHFTYVTLTSLISAVVYSMM
jgi:ABC-type sulfate/molybdate transport systems ATPase subunit